MANIRSVPSRRSDPDMANYVYMGGKPPKAAHGNWLVRFFRRASQSAASEPSKK